MSKTKFLNKINFPTDLKQLNHSELKILKDELREEMISAVSETGGHLGAGLGVVELTVALHYVFDTPKDKIIWSKAAAPLITKNTRAKANYKNHIEAVRNRCKAAWGHDYWPKFYKEVWPKLKKDKQIKKDFL